MTAPRRDPDPELFLWFEEQTDGLTVGALSWRSPARVPEGQRQRVQRLARARAP